MQNNNPAGYLLPIDSEVKKTLLVPYERINHSLEQVRANKERNDENARRALLLKTLKTKDTALGRAFRDGKYDLIWGAIERLREKRMATQK